MTKCVCCISLLFFSFLCFISRFEVVIPGNVDVAAGSTSCGVVLKTLVKAPIYCDGSSVVVLVPLPGGGAGASTRSLFGSGGSISSLRCECELRLRFWEGILM